MTVRGRTLVILRGYILVGRLRGRTLVRPLRGYILVGRLRGRTLVILREVAGSRTRRSPEVRRSDSVDLGSTARVRVVS